MGRYNKTHGKNKGLLHNELTSPVVMLTGAVVSAIGAGLTIASEDESGLSSRMSLAASTLFAIGQVIKITQILAKDSRNSVLPSFVSRLEREKSIEVEFRGKVSEIRKTYLERIETRQVAMGV